MQSCYFDALFIICGRLRIRAFLETLVQPSSRSPARKKGMEWRYATFVFATVCSMPMPSSSDVGEGGIDGLCSQTLHWSSAATIFSTSVEMSLMCDEELCMRTLACRCIRSVAEFRREVERVSCGRWCGSAAAKLTWSLGGVSGSPASFCEATTVMRRLCWSRMCARSPMEQGGGVGSRAGSGGTSAEVGETFMAARSTSCSEARMDAASKEK